MEEAQPSRTALGVAMRRAAHQIFDRPLILEDPLALRILGTEAAAKVRAMSREELEEVFSRTMRFLMAIRSRFTEDALAEAVRHGVRQYVVLGAGLDTSAYRSPYPGLRIFEVDHPATQAWKRWRVAEAGLNVPDTLTYAPVDFEHQTLGEGLAAAGFRVDEPAFFSWLGVTMYLTREAALATLGYIGGLPAGSGVAFDYAKPRHLMSDVEREVFDLLAARVAAVGEPFRLAFAPEELAEEMKRLGFTQLENLDRDQINARFLAGRPDGFEIRGKVAQLMCAWV